VEDAVRICEKVARKNVGVTFNLCHYLRSKPETPLDHVLEIARPHLTLITTCSADKNGTTWAQLIEPLHMGTSRRKCY
jgi:sugar phosphate isomerase/epimerase